MRCVGGVRDSSSNGDVRRQWKTVSGGAGGGNRDGSGTGDGGRQE